MGLKANICQVCGGTLKNCGTYYKCVCCDTEYRIDEAMSKEEMNTYFRKLNAFEDAERNLSVSPPKFDDAESEFELIVQKYPDWSAGYWGLVRAKFGIKFEQDLSGKAVPSCYKSTYEDFRDTDEYKKAVALAETPELRQSYEKMAEYIARVAKEWRAEAQKYDYDVFISFKASNDLDGSETRDAREMHKLYDLLKDKGYRVFFSPVTLITDGVVGKGSEPYIFNALDKAKALIVYGSKKEYFSSTWVQNEWQRYLRAIKAGKKEKDSLLVLYEGFNPKELPQGLRRIQGIEYGISAYPAVLSALERVFRKEDAARNREQELRRAEEEKRKAEQENAQKMQDMMAQLAAMQAELARFKSAPSPMVAKVEQNIPTAPQETIKPQDAKKVVQAPIIEQKNEEFVIENGTLIKYKGRDKIVVIPDGVANIAAETFMCNYVLQSVTIPKTVESIGERAFYYCSNLQNVEISNGVKEIRDEVFCACTKLVDIVIPESVKSIGNGAFSETGLENIVILNGVTSIGDCAFALSHIKKIMLPRSVTNLAEDAFVLCYDLASIVVAKGNKIYHSAGNCVIETATKTLICGCENSIIPTDSSVTSIGNFAFEGRSGLTSITIPDGVASIGERAFSNCSGLANITIPNSVIHIGEEAFFNCNGLKKVSVPKETKIGVCAFPASTKIERY